MKQLITRVDASLAEAVKRRAALSGESVNNYVTRLLSDAVADRRTWKSEAIAAGRLISRAAATTSTRSYAVSTPVGYASELVAADRDDR